MLISLQSQKYKRCVELKAGQILVSSQYIFMSDYCGCYFFGSRSGAREVVKLPLQRRSILIPYCVFII